MNPTIKALIEALAAYCEAPNPRCAGADLWDRIDAALGPRDERTSTATALRALIPTRDPRVDPREGDVLRYRLADGGDMPALTEEIIRADETRLQMAPTIGGTYVVSRDLFLRWDHAVGGIDAVQVLYVAPEVSDVR